MPQCSFRPVALFTTYSCFHWGSTMGRCEGDWSGSFCVTLLFGPSGFRHPHWRHIVQISQCHGPENRREELEWKRRDKKVEKLTFGHRLKWLCAINMIRTIALLAIQHLLHILGLLTALAAFAVHALPQVLECTLCHLSGHFYATWMGWKGRREELLSFRLIMMIKVASTYPFSYILHTWQTFLGRYFGW